MVCISSNKYTFPNISMKFFVETACLIPTKVVCTKTGQSVDANLMRFPGCQQVLRCREKWGHWSCVELNGLQWDKFTRDRLCKLRVTRGKETMMVGNKLFVDVINPGIQKNKWLRITQVIDCDEKPVTKATLGKTMGSFFTASFQTIGIITAYHQGHQEVTTKWQALYGLNSIGSVKANFVLVFCRFSLNSSAINIVKWDQHNSNCTIFD